jgi:cobyrinic acid a,c-diamide synthase
VLPDGISGLYLPGGYPELHGKALSDNASMRESIRQAVRGGLPTVAEGGGFLYLHDSLDGLPLCGVIPGEARGAKKLQRFGYIELTAEQDNLLCKAGESIRSHEFHYFESSSPGADFMARKAGRDLSYPCIHASSSLYAGFPHLFFPANPAFATSFVEKMARHEG